MKNKTISLFLIASITLSIFIGPSGILETAEAQTLASNVLFIPGLMGSRLYKEGLLSENELWVPNRRNDVRQLFLDNDGNSIEQNIYTRDIIDETSSFEIYKGFSTFMKRIVSDGIINEWSAFPYDWRYGIEDIVRQREAPAPTVDIIASRHTVFRGGFNNLFWSSTNADSCVASGGWSGDKPTSGFLRIGPLSSSQTYTLTCSGPGGTASDSFRIRVLGDIVDIEIGARFQLYYNNVFEEPPSEDFAGARLRDRTVYLDEEVERLATTSNTGKVTIFAHSYGGLVAKELMRYLEETGRASLIDRVILVAVPQLGTPDSLLALLHGDLLRNDSLDKRNIIRGLAENMPSAYELIPLKGYFDKVATPVISFEPSAKSIFPAAANYEPAITSSTSLFSFLTGEFGSRLEPEERDVTTPNVLGRNFIDMATSSHAVHENWSEASTTYTIQIVGWGLKTVSQIKYLREGAELDHQPVFRVGGDEKVVSPSANHIADKTYYIDINSSNVKRDENRKHSSILEIKSVQSLLENILTGVDILPEHIFDSVPSIRDEKQLKWTELSVHSPVSIDVYDEFGNHVGISTTTDFDVDFPIIDEDIPNSSFLLIGESKYVNIDSNGSYQIVLQGEDEGLFTLEVAHTSGDEIDNSYIFSNLPVNASTTARVILGSTNDIPIIELDDEGDGIIDTIMFPDGEIDSLRLLERAKSEIISFGFDDKLASHFIKKLNELIKHINKSKADKVTKEVNKFIDKIKEGKGKYEVFKAIDTSILFTVLRLLR